MALTIRKINALQQGRQIGEGNGLFIGNHNGNKIFRHRLKDNSWLELGAYPALDLEAARALNRQVQLALAANHGIDMINHALVWTKNADTFAEMVFRLHDRKLRFVAPTFKAAHEAWHAHCLEFGVWQKGGKHSERCLHDIAALTYPHFGDMPVDQIMPGKIVRAFEAEFAEAYARGNRNLQYVQKIMAHAIRVMGVEMTNPVELIDRTKHLVKPVKRKISSVFLDAGDIAAYYEAFCATRALTAPENLACLVVMFTQVRPTEAVKMRWDAIDWIEQTWRIGLDGAGTPRKVHIPDPLFGLLNNTGEISEWVCPAQANGLRFNMQKVPGYRYKMSTNSWRETFRHWAAQAGYEEHFVVCQLGEEKRGDNMADPDRFVPQRKIIAQHFADVVCGISDYREAARPIAEA